MNTAGKIKLLENTYYIRILNAEDEEIIQNLFERCIDYFEIVEGRFPPKDASHETLTELPPAKGYDDKHVLGYFNEKDELIAVTDIVADYPDKGEWIIGLLIIDPKERGKGLGNAIHEFVKNYALTYNAGKLRIGVVEENKNAHGFWAHLGYQEIKRTNMKCGNKDNIVIVMNLIL